MNKRDRETVLAVAPLTRPGTSEGLDEGQACLSSLPQVAVHNIPCRIEHNGPAHVSAFFQCKADPSPSFDLTDQVLVTGHYTASFRGRALRGAELALPEEVQGLVVEEANAKADGDDTEDDLLDEESEIWDEEDGDSQPKRPRVQRTAQISACFSKLRYWQREEALTLDSIPIQWLTEWLPLNLAINKPVTLEQMQALDFDSLALSELNES